MAGDWIPMRCDLAEAPAVIAIAEETGLEIDAVVGKLHRLWSWANRHLEDGNARSVTANWIDAKVAQKNFAIAMQNAGWLSITSRGVKFPEFDTWNSQGAKRRQLTAKRVASFKAKPGNAASVTKALPKEEKRRDIDIPNGISNATPSRTVFVPPTESEVAEYIATRGSPVDAGAFWNFYESKGWMVGKNRMKDWRRAIVTWEKNRGTGTNNAGGGHGSYRSPARVDDGGLLAQLDAEIAAARNAGSGPGADAASGAVPDSAGMG